MAQFDIESKASQPEPQQNNAKESPLKREFLAWWEVLILILVLFITAFLIYFFFFIAKAKDQIFQPKVSSVISSIFEIDEEVKESKSFDFSNYQSFLLLGIGGEGHAGGALTDSIQVLVLNKYTKDAYLISLPRDLYLKVGNCGEQKINTMFWCGEKTEAGGGAFSKNLVSYVLGIPIDYYVRMDFSGFRDLVNILGGLTIEVEKDFSDSMVSLYIPQGIHHLDGEIVLKYVRSRYTDSDFDRSRRQQQVILAIKDKFLAAKIYLNPIKLYQLINILSQHLRTDIAYQDAIGLVSQFASIKIKNTYVIDNRKDNLLYNATQGGAYILLPKAGDFSQIQEKVQQLLLE